MWAYALLIAIAAYLLYLFYVSVKRGYVPMGPPVSIILLGISIISLGFAAELYAETLNGMLAWRAFQHIGYSMLLFSLGMLLYSYVKGGCSKEWKVLLGFSSLPLLMLILMATDRWHGLYYASVEVAPFAGSTYLLVEPSYGYLAVAVYAAVFLIGILVMIIRGLFFTIEVNVLHMAVLFLAMVTALAVTAVIEPLATAPPVLLEVLALSIVALPIYHVTFSSRIELWSLSYREVLDISSEIKMVVDVNMRVTYGNSMAGCVLQDHKLPEEVESLAASSLENDAIMVEDLELTTGDGDRLFRCESKPLKNRSGSPRGVLLTMVDITVANEMRRSFAEVNEKIRLLSDIIRHDMINQLTVISGLNYMLEDEAEDGTKAHKMVSSINIAVEAIHRQLMFMGDYEMVGLAEPEWLPLKETIEEAARNHDLSRYELVIDVGEHLVFADPMLEKVFLNLIHNSLVHAKNLSRLSFTVEEQGGELLIHYQDDGGGVPEQFRAGLFEKGVGKNSGLGLFLSKNILEITGMSISEEGREGEGVDFIIRVPALNHRSAR